ncbi:hypothetical protein RchiOBHm_Chr2g0110321 [Rosa chinensis]|uniref:Uncharacterized protein n=1 Tax=Rosa chinensis TaxID=74649 RepID=A0A2P6RPN4_ROSCH|nr:hypothetical protein RchiOBHm_Chr5g0062841 [Rosa chinensis]PRQ48402.1 hypothetical protein RchiOBHm_Chr2g0110321 [Rosa chinensis]
MKCLKLLTMSMHINFVNFRFFYLLPIYQFLSLSFCWYHMPKLFMCYLMCRCLSSVLLYICFFFGSRA